MSNTKFSSARNAAAMAKRTRSTVKPLPPLPANGVIQDGYIPALGANYYPPNLGYIGITLQNWYDLVAGKTLYFVEANHSSRESDGIFYTASSQIYDLSPANGAFKGGMQGVGISVPRATNPNDVNRNLQLMFNKYQQNAASSSQGPFGDAGLNSFLNNVIVPVVTDIAIYGATSGLLSGMSPAGDVAVSTTTTSTTASTLDTTISLGANTATQTAIDAGLSGGATDLAAAGISNATGVTLAEATAATAGGSLTDLAINTGLNAALGTVGGVVTDATLAQQIIDATNAAPPTLQDQMQQGKDVVQQAQDLAKAATGLKAALSGPAKAAPAPATAGNNTGNNTGQNVPSAISPGQIIGWLLAAVFVKLAVFS